MFNKIKVLLKKAKSFLFENKRTRQTVAKNTFWLVFGEVGSRGLRSAIVIYAARVLGADGWGVFSYVITLAAFFTLFSDIGLSGILTRETAKNPDKRSQYLSTSLFIKLILVVVSVLLIIFVAPLFTKIEAAKKLLPVVAFILVFDGLREFGFSLNRALERMEREALVKIITNFLIVVLGFASLILFKSVKSLAISYLMGSAAGLLITIWTLRQYFKNLLSNFRKSLLRPIFLAAWPFALMGLMGAIMLNTDAIMLGFWRTAGEIGLYSVAQRVIQITYLIPMLLSIAVFPIFSKLAKVDDKKFRAVLEKSIGIVLMLGIPIVFAGLIFGKEIILVLFGKEYLGAVPTFKVLLFTILFTFPYNFIGSAVFAYDKQKNFIFSLALGAIGNAVLNALLIPNYGIIGAAIATIIAQVLSNGFIWIKMKRINNFKVIPYLPKILITSALMAVFALILQYSGINVFINMTLSVVFYFGLLYFIKEPFLMEIKSTFFPEKS